MSYARFGAGSDVYVFFNANGYLECCGCLLDDNDDYPHHKSHSTPDMIHHLEKHEKTNHSIPTGIYSALKRDDADNFPKQ